LFLILKQHLDENAKIVNTSTRKNCRFVLPAYNLENQKGRWNNLREAAENEGIIIGVKGIRKLMNKWFETKTLTDLRRIDRAVYIGV
jgi:hypothetical protein